MKDKHDPVENALRSLGGRQWPGANHNVELENVLMQSMQPHRTSSWLSRHRVAAAVLGMLVLASAGFAAVGGIDLVRSWFVTIEVNGEVVAEGEYPVDETGTTTIQLPELGGDEAVVSIEVSSAEPADGEGGSRTVNVSINEDGEATIQVVPEDDDTDDD